MEIISGFGTVVQVVASITFPGGFNVTELADDADPVDVPSNQIADKAMGVNGDLIAWAKANPIAVTLAVIPDGGDDDNLQILLEANRPAKNKTVARDVITMSVQFPNGRFVLFSKGLITDGMSSDSIASAGRLKTKPYIFAFENRTVTQ